MNTRVSQGVGGPLMPCCHHISLCVGPVILPPQAAGVAQGRPGGQGAQLQPPRHTAAGPFVPLQQQQQQLRQPPVIDMDNLSLEEGAQVCWVELRCGWRAGVCVSGGVPVP